MTVWFHLPTIFRRRHALLVAGLLTVFVAFITTLLFAISTHAAPGVNQTLNFQGRLLNSTGGLLPDGNYNIQFKMYQDGAGTTAGNPGGALKWTESYVNNGGTSGVKVRNGFFSVTLGSVTPFGNSIDWNQDTLWLSMNIAGSSASCTTFGTGPCVADGEMLPMNRLTATPFSLNSAMLGGKTADGFIQNTTTAQTADFNISGTGKATTLQGNTSVIAPLFDRDSTGTLAIGTVNATTINLGVSDVDQTINIGTGDAVKALTIGSSFSNSGILLQGGTQGVRIETSGGFAVHTSSTNRDSVVVTANGQIKANLSSGQNFEVNNSLDQTVFRVSDDGVIYTSIGSSLYADGGATFARGITVQGSGALTYTTPGGYNMSTAINIPNYTVGDYSSVLAFGLPSTSSATARGLLVADGRTGTHQASIGVLSANEDAILGLSYSSDAGTGNNAIGTLANTGNSVALQGNGLNLLTATNNAGAANVGIGNNASSGYALDVTGTIRATSALYTPAVDTAAAGTLTIGGTNATSINLAQNVTVAAGKSLTLNGGATNTRPASPTEGMLYFDTDTKELLVYANGKWQADRSTATKIVAASNSTQSAKDSADYVATGTNDQTVINTALTAAAGGKVYLIGGAYTTSDAISIPNNTTLVGSGSSNTTIKFSNISGQNKNMITNTDTSTGTGVAIQDLRLDGNSSVNTTGTQYGIYLNGVGSSSGSTTVQGAILSNLWISNFASDGARLVSSQHAIITNNTFQGNTSYGIYMSLANRATVTGNTFQGNTGYGVGINGTAYGTYSNNNLTNNGTGGFMINGSSSKISILGNNIRDNGAGSANNAISLTDTSSNTISGNTISDNSATTTNYAISITNSGAANNTISNNTIWDGTVNDLGTGTVYAGQLDSTGKIINKTTSGSSVQTTTNTANAFTVQNAAGTNAFSVDTTSNTVLVAGSLDTTAAAGLTLGSSSATSITIGKTASNIATTVLGTAVFKPTTGNDSTSSFQLQRADGTKMLVADSTNQTITFGDPASANKTIISTSTGQITKYGTARNTKKITLNAEYTGSVLDAGSGGSNTGTMTSSVDLANRMNFYNWTTSQTSPNSYDVVVQVPLPNDFDGWASSNPLSIATRTSNTTNGTISLEARDSTNTVRCNFVNVTPGSIDTWSTNNSACTLGTGTYTAGDSITLRIRMQSQSGANIRAGDINLSYLSKY